MSDGKVTAADIMSTEFPRTKTIEWAGCFVTDPVHGGKVTCHKCVGFIQEKDYVGYLVHQHKDEFPKAHFHKACFNRYEHYYGLDRPLD